MLSVGEDNRVSTRTKPTGSPSCPHLRWGAQGGGRGKGSADAANPLQASQRSSMRLPTKAACNTGKQSTRAP